MRKYLIGAFVGILLTLASSVYASDITSLIGKTVQGVFPVKVNGDTLAKTAIVIDGTSYLPVRAIGDAIGYDVSFNADLGIELKKKEVVPMSSSVPLTTSTATLAPTVTDTVYSIEEIETNIRFAKSFISGFEYNLRNNPENVDAKDQLKKYSDELAIWEARKADLSK
jgi:hypothetical protein